MHIPFPQSLKPIQHHLPPLLYHHQTISSCDFPPQGPCTTHAHSSPTKPQAYITSPPSLPVPSPNHLFSSPLLCVCLPIFRNQWRKYRQTPSPMASHWQTVLCSSPCTYFLTGSSEFKSPPKDFCPRSDRAPSFFLYSSRINAKEPIANASTKLRGDQGLIREHVVVVLERLSTSCSQEGEQLKAYMSFDELFAMFEEEEPSLEKVKATFSVFEESCDGFIDTTELQRVLSKLGLGQGFSLDDCKQMTAVHDENKDGNMDFGEFVKFLESSLCSSLSCLALLFLFLFFLSV